METKATTYDVFISHAHQDSTLAETIAEKLRAYQLQVFTDAQVETASLTEEALWQAMAESQAMIALISTPEPSASMAFEIGAATAWNKPIYVVVTEPSTIRMPRSLSGLKVYPLSRVEEIASELKRASDSLSGSEIAILIEEYAKIGVSVDRLALDSAALSNLTKQFNKAAKRQVSGEKLLWSLLRLRKGNVLPPVKKIPKKRDSKP